MPVPQNIPSLNNASTAFTVATKNSSTVEREAKNSESEFSSQDSQQQPSPHSGPLVNLLAKLFDFPTMVEAGDAVHVQTPDGGTAQLLITDRSVAEGEEYAHFREVREGACSQVLRMPSQALAEIACDAPIQSRFMQGHEGMAALSETGEGYGVRCALRGRLLATLETQMPDGEEIVPSELRRSEGLFINGVRALSHLRACVEEARSRGEEPPPAMAAAIQFFENMEHH